MKKNACYNLYNELYQVDNNMTIKKWIDAIIDEGSFLPLYPDHVLVNQPPLTFGAEVVAGLAQVNSRPVALYAHNTLVNRGYVTQQGTVKILRLMEKARVLQIPIIAFLASPGISLEEDLRSAEGYTQIISKNIALSGLVPQLAVIMAPTLGAPAYSAVLMDFTFFTTHRSYLMVTSPMVVQQAIGEKVTMSELGGARMHAQITGIADFLDENMAAQLQQVKAMIDFLPSCAGKIPPMRKVSQPQYPLPAIPSNPRQPFNMIELIQALVDDSLIMQYKKGFGQAMICAFVHINGYAVGLVANQSIRLSGAIDSDAAQKAAQFIRLCDAYSIPILTLIDVPGFMPGKREEQRGLLQHGARLCTAMQTQVPRLSVVVRKCYGAAAFLMMQTHSQEGDLVLALETASLGVMGKETTSKVRQVDEAATDDGLIKKTLENEGVDDSLAMAFSMGLIDEIIPLAQMRTRLSQHLEYVYLKMDGKKTCHHLKR